MGLSWPQIRCTEDANLESEEIFDQIATASENIVEAVKYSKNPQEQISSIPSSESAAVHYENSNGFVPIVPSYSNPDSYDSSLEIDDSEQQENQSEESDARNVVSAQDSSDARAKKFEEDLAYSSEARIFLNYPGSLTNRRSFDFQEGRTNDFELLKINNDTPAVANYQEFYKNVRSTVNTETDSEPDTSSSGISNEGRGKKTYTHNYGQQSQQINDEDSYAQYSYDTQDTKKITHEQEKVTDNYRQVTANYDGHGQNAATVSSSSRTNYQVNELAPSGTYDNVPQLSRTHYRFKPVVVAEPNNHKTDMKFDNHLLNSGSDTTLESSSSEMSNRYRVYNDNRQRSYHRTEDSKNLSDESTDYSEYIERPRVQKTRRRPLYTDSSRKLPKEHRGTMNDSTEEDKQKYNSPKIKSQRYKTNPWLNDPSINHRDESVEDVRHGSRGSNTETKSSKVHNGSRSKISSWNQISPSVEVSHSNVIELDQVEKPKFLVNLVPIGNFDHATALGNSQGFDVSNAVLQNVATVAPIGAFSTTSPQPVIAQNFAQLSKNLVNLQNLAVSTPMPDIIVGQNTFQNPVHTVFLPHPNEQNKDLRGYLPSTMTPLFALTSSLSPALQNIRVQNVQSNNLTPRTTFTITPTPNVVHQQMPINQVHSGIQQLIVPQPTLQTFSNFLQSPLQQIHVNPHGLQGQNLIHHGNLQIQSSPTTSTILSSQTMPESRLVESHNKKNTYSASGTNFVASANLAVDQNEQKQPTNINSYYLQNQNTQQIVKPQEIVPNIYPSATLSDITVSTQQLIPQQNEQNGYILQQPRDQMQQYVKLQNNGADAMQQALLNKNLIKNHRLGGITLQAVDNTASHSSNINVNVLEPSPGNAHLPNVGTKNVEIVNPNIKPSPIDTYQTINYPNTVLTTPIPIFSTIAPVNSHTVLPNFVNSLTENGNKAKQIGTFQNQERPMFNPINFVPNVDIIKDQNVLNNKPAHEPIQQGLNLVPVVPGGNFFKPSLAAQSELIVKPKLTSDLQKYAEEMFKESLKTMYNSQKWNNDRIPQSNSQNNSEASDLAKLRIEMQKLRASLTESKYKDNLEAHQSMHDVHMTNAPKSSSKKKPDPLIMTLEQLLKTRPRGPIHIYHGPVKPDEKRKPEDVNFDVDDFKDESRIREFLTPPKSKPSHSKSRFHDKPKKRPGSLRFKNNPRRPTRPSNLPHKSDGLQSSSSDIHLYVNSDFNYDSKHQPSFDKYTVFTTSSPEIDKMLREFKLNNKKYDINHPRMHNLLGMMMKNKQLPTRSTQNYFRNKDQVREYFENEKHRLQQQFYNNALRDYMNDGSDVASQSESVINKKVYSGIGTA